MITIKEMTSKKEMIAFIKFPFKLYKDNKQWVPPLVKGELESFNPKINPVFEHASARFFVALKDGKIVGRVAAIINDLEINQMGEKRMRFGWMDFIDDLEVSKSLLNKIEEIGIQNKLKYMEGPMGFSNLNEVGVLTKGYDDLGTMVTWYNYPYYVTHFEKHGFKVGKRYVENRFKFKDVDKAKFNKLASIVERRYGYVGKSYKTTKELMPHIDVMFNLFNHTYENLESFVPVTEKQIAYFKKKFLSFIHPEMLQFVYSKEEMIGFAITMPSFSRALQKANGYLFPFGFIPLLMAKRNSKDVLFYLIGIHPEHQGRGIPAIIFNEYYKVFEKLNVENCVRTPELANNEAAAGIWKTFKQETFKTRVTFKKSL